MNAAAVARDRRLAALRIRELLAVRRALRAAAPTRRERPPLLTAGESTEMGAQPMTTNRA